jgi:hypothetical protein
MVQRKQRAQLRKVLAGRFSKEELRTLCFDLGIPYENLPEGLDGLARELIIYCEKRDRLPELVETARELRSDVDWEDLAPATAPARVAHSAGTVASGVWRCPAGAQGARYVGSITSRKYHVPECGWARRIAPENRLCFADRGAARAFGYLPCGICEPPS